MSAITIDRADKIMHQIGYIRHFETSVGEAMHECWYYKKELENFGPCIIICLSDGSYRFQYCPEPLKSVSVLSAGRFSDIERKKRFLKWYNNFISDAYWLSLKYVDPQIMESEEYK